MGEEQYRITIKPERLLEPCFERSLRGWKVLDFDGHTYHRCFCDVDACACPGAGFCHEPNLAGKSADCECDGRLQVVRSLLTTRVVLFD